MPKTKTGWKLDDKEKDYPRDTRDSKSNKSPNVKKKRVTKKATKEAQSPNA